VLARKDLLLEARSRELVFAMALFSLAGFVLLHFAVASSSGEVSPRVASGLLWIVVLLAALLALNRVFAPEREEGLLDALLLTPVDRAAIWLGKAMALLVLLVTLELVALPLWWLLLLSDPPAGEPTPSLLVVAGTLLLADVGLAAVGALLAALASAARQREVLLPLLFLPTATPALLAGLSACVASADGDSVLRYVGLLAVYDLLFAVLAWGISEYVLTE
jgi:heme exporter protein B